MPMSKVTMQKLFAAAHQRRESARSRADSYSRDIKYHDQMATEIRAKRQKERSKIDRSEKTIERLGRLLDNEGQ